MAESSSTSPASSPPAAADASAVSRINGRIIGICVAAALGGFLFGFDTAVINGAVDALSGEFVLNDALKGFSVSSALIGCTVGAWFAGPVSNRMGRVPVMLIAAVMFMASALGSGLAFGVVDFIVWRVVGGLGVGAASVIAPAYIAEVSPASVRGRLGSLQQLAIVISIFVSLLTDAMLANFADGAAKPLWFGMAAWRWMFLAETVPALVYGLFAFRLPESPRFLVARGDYDKASQVLYDFTGIVNVNLKIEEIRSTLDSEKRESLADLRGPALGLRPIVWVGILLSVFQQFVGINVIFYYSTTLWRTVGFQESDALTITVITSVTNIAVTILAILLVDKVGRRPMLLVGSIVMTLSLGMMALAFSFADVSGSDITLSAPGRPSRWCPPTCSSSPSAPPGGRWCGCCSARCSPTGSAPGRWPWPRRPSGWPISSSPPPSRPSPASASPSPTASTPRAPCCRSSSSSSGCPRPRARSWRRWRTCRSDAQTITKTIKHTVRLTELLLV